MRGSSRGKEGEGHKGCRQNKLLEAVPVEKRDVQSVEERGKYREIHGLDRRPFSSAGQRTPVPTDAIQHTNTLFTTAGSATSGLAQEISIRLPSCRTLLNTDAQDLKPVCRPCAYMARDHSVSGRALMQDFPTSCRCRRKRNARPRQLQLGQRISTAVLMSLGVFMTK